MDFYPGMIPDLQQTILFMQNVCVCCDQNGFHVTVRTTRVNQSTSNTLLIFMKEQRTLPKPPSCYCGRMSVFLLV